MYCVPNNSVNKIHRLAKDCANNYSGECVLLDCECVVANAYDSTLCNYFVKAVLPMDTDLYNAVMISADKGSLVKKHNKTCKECKAKFKTPTKNTQFCPKCAKKKKSEKVVKSRRRKNG
jgi:hypothetical protein